VQQADLNRENSMVLYLSQALLGAVFPNLVAASVEVRPSDVVAHFRVASPPDPADLEDLEDIEVDFNAFVGPTCVIGGPDETSTQVHIGPAVKSSPVLPGRMVFLRKP
jgi:hypothetical protein